MDAFCQALNAFGRACQGGEWEVAEQRRFEALCFFEAYADAVAASFRECRIG
jgi:hypothetical protein